MWKWLLGFGALGWIFLSGSKKSKVEKDLLSLKVDPSISTYIYPITLTDEQIKALDALSAEKISEQEQNALKLIKLAEVIMIDPSASAEERMLIQMQDKAARQALSVIVAYRNILAKRQQSK